MAKEKDKVTDDELDVASKETTDNDDSVTDSDAIKDVEKKKEEEGEETVESLKEKLKESHKERSRLGRRISAIERESIERNERLESAIGKIESFTVGSRQQENDVVDDEYLTASKLNQVLNAREQKTNDDINVYQRDYKRALSRLGDNEELEFYDAVVAEMTKTGSPFNDILSDNPYADAEINYLRATKAVLKKANAPKKNPLEGKKPDGALGVGGDTTITDKRTFTMPKLDADSQDYFNYVKRKGMKDTSIEKAFTKDDVNPSKIGL